MKFGLERVFHLATLGAESPDSCSRQYCRSSCPLGKSSRLACSRTKYGVPNRASWPFEREKPRAMGCFRSFILPCSHFMMDFIRPHYVTPCGIFPTFAGVYSIIHSSPSNRRISRLESPTDTAMASMATPFVCNALTSRFLSSSRPSSRPSRRAWSIMPHSDRV